MRALLYILIFISFTDLFAQLPITSTYARSIGATTGFIGFIVGAYSLSNLFSNLYSGYFVDRKGPKLTLLIGFLINGFILILYSFVTSPFQLLAIRFLNGLSAGIITPAAFTYLSLLNRGKKSGKTFAFSGASVGLAAICGPAFSGIIASKAGSEVVYIIIGCLMILAFFITLCMKSVTVSQNNSNQKSSRQFFELFSSKGLVFAFVGAICLSASQGILAYMLPLKVYQLEMADHISGMLMSIFGVIAILFFMLPTNKVYDRFSNEILLPIGMIIISVSQAISGFGQNLTTLLISMIIYGIGFAIVFPSMSNLVAKYSKPKNRGTAFGVFYACYSLGSFLGTSLTGAFSLPPREGFYVATIFLFSISIASLMFIRKKSSFHT
ncbi:MFS transporter [Bacillus andreraoultii]|uniref:MFS transporter n=1 Tax=Bacillus andreraoultii TaxID=1499685 RepID=UPI00053A4334|nr:MFS transporter [Bacillus andreraoultii]